MKKIVTISIAFLALAACSSSAQGPNMKDGKWEIQTSLEMSNMPFSVPPASYTQCLTQKDLIPGQNTAKQEQPCEVTENTISGDTVSWTVVCNTPQGKSTSSGKITYKGESFEGEITVNPGPNMPPMKQRMTGKRLGACE